MNVELEDWNNGWFGLEIGLSQEEIDILIKQLLILKQDNDQHFHLTSDYEGKGGIGDIQIYVKENSQENNMSITRKALGPGEEV